MLSIRGALRALPYLLLALSAPVALAQSVSLVGGAPPVQDFNTLAASGTSAALPDGWYLAESGTNADATYAADNGALNSGNSYSYGATGSSERALGTLQSGSVAPMIGAQLRNDSSNTLSEIVVSYTGEEWRLGVAGRSDLLVFEFSTNAISLADAAATWNAVPALDLATPNTAATAGALDGNAAANRTSISATISGLALAPNATVWVRWRDTNISGSDDGLAIDDVSFAIDGTPPVDEPPTVTGTAPANNAVDVALAAPLTVTFSEAVTVAAGGFSIVCASAAQTATVSGGPVSWTLTPDQPLPANTTCSLTVIASAVADQDGIADPLAADYTVAFHTVDPTQVPPPSVLSIEPSDGATAVPATAVLDVTFDRSVMTSPGAFALACNASSVALDESGSGATRSLAPQTLLPANADCTFDVIATNVQDANGVHPATDAHSSFHVSDGSVGGYYSQVNTSSPEQLRCTLHALIRNHTVYPYSGGTTNTWTVLEAAQTDPANANQIIDVYRNRAYTKVSARAGTGSGLTYNREHTWPNSLGFPSTTGDLGLDNAPYTDAHMLYLSDTQWNADRGNSPYGNCTVPASCAEDVTEANGGFGGGSGTYPGNSNWYGNNTFETWGHRKGDVARAVMYMAIRYEGGLDSRGQTEPDLELTDDRAKIIATSNYAQPAYMGLLSDLLAWNLADPPDTAERARDEVVFTYQHNRNPFVDHPEWATLALFQSSEPTTCIPGSGNDVIFTNGFDGPP